MMEFFSRRWNGQVALRLLLWRDLLGVGSFINIASTVLALILASQGVALGVAAALHFACLPYNLFLFGAVWRHPLRTVPTAVVAAVWLAVMTLI